MDHGVLFVSTMFLISGCANVSNNLPSAGPSRYTVTETRAGYDQIDHGISIVSVNNEIIKSLLVRNRTQLFSEVFSANVRSAVELGPGDVVELSIWEAPPASLFGAMSSDIRPSMMTSHNNVFPEQMVTELGDISVPFVGSVKVGGRSPREVEAEIKTRLKGKANLPQVLLRVIHNNTSNVTIVGEVTTSTKMPLTARGERLLDALAAAGGTKQAISKISLQVTRDEKVRTLPLDLIIRDAKQNIRLQPGDVITSLFQSQSFTVLGATGKNEEINFEASGISLAQALARAGGLNDAKADSSGVFLFRYERRPGSDDHRYPVIYQLDMRAPAAFFLAQKFKVEDRDLLYVANAGSVELQKFLSIVSAATGPFSGLAPLTDR